MISRKLHKFLSLVISIQLLLWTISGIYFSFNKIEEVRGSHYLKGEASDEGLEKANQQLNEILKDLSLGLMAVIPLAPITIPMIAKFAKKHNIDLLPEWFKDSLK